jgi:hypothetical protein
LEAWLTMARRYAMPVCLAVLSVPLGLEAQGSAGSGAKLEPRTIVDLPTAGMLDRGAMGWDLEFYQDGGLLAGVSYGVFDWWSVGISYGGSGLVGSGTPVMNPLPGFEIRFRPLEENIALPAIVLGFSSQGRGAYMPASDRYTYKSPGFFATLSKNYMMLGFLSLHAGVNYSLERADGDRDMNVFFGADKTLLPFVSVVMEYNLALNDNSSGSNGRGYLSAGLRCSFGGGATFGFFFKDMLKNSENVSFANRTASFEFIHLF